MRVLLEDCQHHKLKGFALGDVIAKLHHLKLG